jgi:Xaa-Pro aminopeptidase
MADFETRRGKALKAAQAQGADALLVTNFANVTYLTGFTGDDSYLLVDKHQAVVLSDPRYTTQLEEECPGLELFIRPPGMGMLQAVVEVVGAARVRHLGVEGESITLSLANQIREGLKQAELVSTSRVVEDLREVKDKHEIAQIREAIWFAEKAFGVLKAALRREQSEKQVADDLENQLRLFGAKGASFPPIVAVGDRAALPHARPTDQKIGAADFVLVDWGASGRLYKSDLTRVLATGRIPPKLERIYRLVLQAQLAAIEAIRPGVTCHEVDAVARGIIGKGGHGAHFGHGLGHGIGLEIHEGPRLAAQQHCPLRPGMVVTVEPGVYLPGWGGVRIEDDVLVTKTGHEVLTTVGKQIEDVIVAC